MECSCEGAGDCKYCPNSNPRVEPGKHVIYKIGVIERKKYDV